MSRWRPSPAEERWLAVAARLGSAVPRAALEERTGGWRSTGPFARIALFVLGFFAAALLFGILGFNDETMLLVAGLMAALAAEWLSLQKRLHASGIEEGLCLGGFLMIGLWITTLTGPGPGFGWGPADGLVLIAAAGAAGLRRLNPFVTTGATIAFVYWVDSTTGASLLDQRIGDGLTAFLVGCGLTVFALALGAREYRRPSHDRMLDWLVAALPVAAYAQPAPWSYFELGQALGGADASRLLIVLPLLALGVTLLVTGLRRRRHAPLLGFLVCVACLALELKLATTLAPETWLILCGLIALVAGMLVDRRLRQPRDGVTSARLDRREGPLDLLQTAGAALLAQRTASAMPTDDATYTGDGGRFGGGGASGSY